MVAGGNHIGAAVKNMGRRLGQQAIPLRGILPIDHAHVDAVQPFDARQHRRRWSQPPRPPRRRYKKYSWLPPFFQILAPGPDGGGNGVGGLNQARHHGLAAPHRRGAPEWRVPPLRVSLYRRAISTPISTWDPHGSPPSSWSMALPMSCRRPARRATIRAGSSPARWP